MTDEPTENVTDAEVVPDEAGPVEPPGDAGSIPTDLRDIDDFKPSSAELAVRDPSDVFRAFDRFDEILILDELQGKVLTTWVYSFTPKGGGQEMTDLSVVGINETVRLLNREGRRIRVAPEPQPIVTYFEDEEGDRMCRVMVYAEDTADGSGDWGAAVEPTHPVMKGKKKYDKFHFAKALNKAGRNAKKKLIPEDYRQTIIATVKQDPRRVQHLKSIEAESVQELPPPAVGPEAEELRKQARDVYLEIKAINPMVVPPGRFDALFTSSDHAVEKLRSFVEWLGKEKIRALELQERDAEARGRKPEVAGEMDEETEGGDA